MNREILFRGQTRKYGEKVTIGTGKKLPGRWVYGGVFPGAGDFSIIYGWEAGEEQTGCNIKKWTVYSDTVGQYVGMTDKNGTKIFEGDIVRIVYDGVENVFVVIWDSGELDFKATNGKENYGPGGFEYLPCCELVEVIGNIHDNPELLKEAALCPQTT